MSQTTARITLSNGVTLTITQGTPVSFGNATFSIVPSQDGLALLGRNGGGPDNFYGNKPWHPEPLYFDRLEIDCEGVRPQLAELMQATRQGNTWIITDPSKFHHHHKRALALTPRPGLVEQPQAEYIPSLAHHMIDGGDTLYVLLVPETDHLGYGVQPSPDGRIRAMGVADLDPVLQGHPAVRRILDLYRVTPDSFVRNAKYRNWGWWLVPENFRYQWTSQNIESVRGWYPAGDLRSPSDGPSNCHYDHDSNALIEWLLTGDQTALFLGMTLARTKVAYGLIDTDLPRSACNLRGWWRGEKGGFRRGEGVGSSTNKEWDAGLCLAWCLYPDDPILMRGMAVRRECLLQRDNAGTWNHAGGGRAIGHYLFNLLDHFRATGDQAFANRASSFIDHVFTLTGSLLHFPNTLRPTHYSCWEEAMAHSAIAKWISLGVGTQYTVKLQAMIDWLLVNGSEVVSPGKRRVVYEIELATGIKTFAGWPTGALWSRLPQSQIRDEVTAYTLSLVPNPASVVNGGLGPGFEKNIGWLANMVRG